MSTHTSLICSAAVNKNRSLSLTQKYLRVTCSSGTAEDSDEDKHTWSLGREEERGQLKNKRMWRSMTNQTAALRLVHDGPVIPVKKAPPTPEVNLKHSRRTEIST